MRPVRISSEGPEVVSDSRYQHEQHSPDKYLVPFSEIFDRQPTIPVIQNLPDEQQTSPQPQLYSPPPKGYDNLPYMTHDQDHERHERDRGFPLLTTILLVLVAFIIGGGIAGGVGGAMVVKRQDKIASLQNEIASASASRPTATTTATAPACQPTVWVDQAACPNINNSTYKSDMYNSKFLQLCGVELTPPAGTNTIDISKSQQSSWPACLDACSNYNQNVKAGGCRGATWYMFWPADPSKNSMCYLKSAVGYQNSANSSVGLVVSGQLQDS